MGQRPGEKVNLVSGDKTLAVVGAILAILYLMGRKKAARDGQQTLNVAGRTLLPPGLWRTEDWQTWQRVRGPV
jgi:hypothetical protein